MCEHMHSYYNNPQDLCMVVYWVSGAPPAPGQHPCTNSSTATIVSTSTSVQIP